MGESTHIHAVWTKQYVLCHKTHHSLVRVCVCDLVCWYLVFMISKWSDECHHLKTVFVPSQSVIFKSSTEE